MSDLKLILLSEHKSKDIPLSKNFSICFKQLPDCKCIATTTKDSQTTLTASYYIGVDWLIKNEFAVYVKPKLNDSLQQTDYLRMLSSCLKYSDEVVSSTHIANLYEIKFNEPFVEINQDKDLLTPLLIIQFLQLLKIIVRKGLKKSYYRVNKNLNSKIKGKILTSQNLKQNIVKNKSTRTFCQYDEFGFNSVENRILKRTLLFVQKFIALFPNYSKFVSEIISYCQVAFSEIDDNVSLSELKMVKHNSFFKEYKEGLHLASLILRRFGYNIKDIESTNERIIKVPPFWIDMSKLFELYVLGLLKNKYHNQIQFQIQGSYGQPDFILVNNTERMIIDTKYKTRYQSRQKVSESIIDDIRQLSAYSRDTGVLIHLGLETEAEQDRIIDCLIIYPDQEASENLGENLKETLISGITRFYKMPIKLPTIGNNF